MSIYTIPYTYIIGWTKHNKWYYGVRYADKCNPSDLWSTYFTSSKIVKRFRVAYGEPDVIEVRRTFKTKWEACSWEVRVLKRIGVPSNKHFLNGHCGGAGYNAILQSIKSTKGFCTAYDTNGQSYRIKTDDSRLLSGELFGNRKGKINCLDKELGTIVDICIDEFHLNRNRYIHQNEGKTRTLPSRIGKAHFFDENLEIVLISVNEAKARGLKSALSGKSLFRDTHGIVRRLPVNHPSVIDGTVVGVNRGKSINKSKAKPATVCSLDDKKEYTLHNYNQHIRKLDRKKILVDVAVCVCDIKTKKHYPKAAWNRFFPDAKISHQVKNTDCFIVQVERFVT